MDGHTGCMVALYPPTEMAADLAVDGGLPADELHLTLAYLGEAAMVDVGKLNALVAAFAMTCPPISARVNGVGFFADSHVDMPVTWASVDAPALPAAREQLVRQLLDAGFPVAQNHGFTPHMTLAYADRRDLDVTTADMTFSQIWVVAGGERVGYDLTGVVKEAARLTVVEPAPFDLGEIRLPSVQEVRAFVAEVGAKTIITAPVAAIRTEKASANPHYLWVDGAYVGSEEPNRNGALWTTADLEFGAPSVAHGPLNWLHDGRFVVGSIVSAALVHPHETAEEGRDHPYIHTTSAMWTWLYPEESQIVQQAAEWGKLWHSMECISESVLCAGENGCGQSFPYMDMIRGKACEHVRERSSTRRFQNPTFLGGALILPPARPGWAHANASVKARAVALAEAAFDQAGRPDMTASEWELLMGSVIAAAESEPTP